MVESTQVIEASLVLDSEVSGLCCFRDFRQELFLKSKRAVLGEKSAVN